MYRITKNGIRTTLFQLSKPHLHTLRLCACARWVFRVYKNNAFDWKL